MKMREKLDQVLSAGPGAGALCTGIVFLSDEPHNVFSALSRIALVWTGLAFISYISRGGHQ